MRYFLVDFWETPVWYFYEFISLVSNQTHKNGQYYDLKWSKFLSNFKRDSSRVKQPPNNPQIFFQLDSKDLILVSTSKQYYNLFSLSIKDSYIDKFQWSIKGLSYEEIKSKYSLSTLNYHFFQFHISIPRKLTKICFKKILRFQNWI